MTLEEARKIINTTGSSIKDANAANAVLNEQAAQYGINPAKLMGEGSPAAPPPVRDTPPGNKAFRPGYEDGQRQFADDATSQQLAEWLGGTVESTNPQAGPYTWDPQDHININGQLFNAGLLASRFSNMTPSAAMRSMSDEIASLGGQPWTPPEGSPFWSAATDQYGDAGEFQADLGKSYGHSRYNDLKPPPGRTGGGSGGGGGAGGGAGAFPVSGDPPRDIDFPGTGGYVPTDPDNRNLPPGFNPYAEGDEQSYGTNSRRPYDRLRSTALQGGLS